MRLLFKTSWFHEQLRRGPRARGGLGDRIWSSGEGSREPRERPHSRTRDLFRSWSGSLPPMRGLLFPVSKTVQLLLIPLKCQIRRLRLGESDCFPGTCRERVAEFELALVSCQSCRQTGKPRCFPSCQAFLGAAPRPAGFGGVSAGPGPWLWTQLSIQALARLCPELLSVILRGAPFFVILVQLLRAGSGCHCLCRKVEADVSRDGFSLYI